MLVVATIATLTVIATINEELFLYDPVIAEHFLSDPSDHMEAILQRFETLQL